MFARVAMLAAAKQKALDKSLFENTIKQSLGQRVGGHQPMQASGGINSSDKSPRSDRADAGVDAAGDHAGGEEEGRHQDGDADMRTDGQANDIPQADLDDFYMEHIEPGFFK